LESRINLYFSSLLSSSKYYDYIYILISSPPILIEFGYITNRKREVLGEGCLGEWMVVVWAWGWGWGRQRGD
jgi:hypothetical protein